LETGSFDDFQIHEDNVWILKHHEDKNLLISGADDMKLKMFDLKSNKEVLSFKPFRRDFESGVSSIEIDD